MIGYVCWLDMFPDTAATMSEGPMYPIEEIEERGYLRS